MFVLHVDLVVEPATREALEKAYREIFAPAISSQEGFDSANLLRPSGDEAEYRLSIAFDQQARQQKWVVSELHQRVWPEMERQCSSYSVKAYNTV